MSTLEPRDPDYKARVQKSFDRQTLMKTMGVKLKRIEPGEVDLEMPFQPAMTQQHGFLHAGVVSAILDSACGYAAFSLMPADRAVLAIEFKVNFIAPAKGDRFLARGRVMKAGRTIAVCDGKLFVYEAEQEKLVAVMQSSIMAVEPRVGVEQ